MNRDRILGVFAKQPVAGQVKTRLAQATSPEWAARLAEAFLRDTLQRLESVAVHRVVVFSPPDSRAYFEDLAMGGWQLEAQRDGTLGQRLLAFLDDHFARGARGVVVVGSDSPTLPPSFVADAFTALESHDVVLGPAVDGGYYLLGLSRPMPDIFHDIDWGGARVLEQTVLRMADARLHLLPPWHDVDTLEDYHFLRGHVLALRMANPAAGGSWTEALLGSLDGDSRV